MGPSRSGPGHWRWYSPSRTVFLHARLTAGARFRRSAGTPSRRGAPMLQEEIPVHAPDGISGVETRSIDWIPENERHGKLWHQLPLWFLGNFQYFSIPIGFVGPSLGL